MHDASDIDLLRQYARENSQAAFATLVERHVNLVYSAALRQTRNSHAAEEITQAVFILLAQKAGRISDRTILPGWLYQTARLTAAGYLKREYRRVRREQEAFMQSESPADPATDALWTQLTPLLEAAMGRLNHPERDAVVLRFFNGKSFAEVAAATGISENAAKKRVNRALEKLHRHFSRQGISSTAGMMTDAMLANPVQAAPAGLAQSVAVLAAAKGVAAGSSTLTLIQGALKLMAWSKAKTALIGIAVLVVAGTGAVVVRDTILVPREPAFQGRPLLAWLADLDYDQPPEKRTPAGEALRQMGPKTLPFLLADLGVPRYAKVHYAEPDLRTADIRSRQATWGMDALGPVARPAIPELMTIMQANPGYVPGALAGIGRDALPELLGALTNENFWVRDNAAACLANGIYAGKILPADAAPAFPIALENLADAGTSITNVNNRARAADLLHALHMNPEVSVPALTKGLDDSAISVAMGCAHALGSFGSEAESAVPALLKASRSTNTIVSTAATQALASIHTTIPPPNFIALHPPR